MRRAAPLIVGGGPAGAAAAIALARGGVAALVLERQRDTGDGLCGGFLSWETLRRLHALGVTPAGHVIERVRLFAGEAQAEARLPAPAQGLSRRALDSALLARAPRVERGHAVKSLDELGDADIFLATGKHDLRGCPRPRPQGDATLGLRVRLPAHPALARLIGDAIELHLCDRGYAGLLLQEDGSANLCMAVRKSRLADAGGRPEALLAELARGPLGERLAFMASPARIDAIGAVPYGWRVTAAHPGFWRLGDQAAVIPSLAGEGIGIALASGVAAAESFLAGEAARAYQCRVARLTRRPVQVGRALWAMAERPVVAAASVRLARALPSLARAFARATRVGD